MTETHGYFGDSTDVRYYNQTHWLSNVRDHRINGYIEGEGSELKVVASDPVAMTVSVGIGKGWVQGNYYSTTSAVTLTIATADSALPRIDRIVLRNTITGTRKIQPVVITGTAASTPSAPAYTRTTEVYDLVLADVVVAAGATSISDANITDQRANTTYCGTASPLSVRYSDLIAQGAGLDMNSYKITGVDLPTADTDVVTLAYRDSVAPAELVGMIDVFAGVTVPAKYLECDGTAKSRTTYSALYAVIGDLYGSGDGTTTFNLPDLTGRGIVGYDPSQNEFDTIGETGGAATVALTEATTPAHTHGGVITEIVEGLGTNGSNESIREGPATTSTGSTGSGTAHANLPPYIVMKYIIRYEV